MNVTTDRDIYTFLKSNPEASVDTLALAFPGSDVWTLRSVRSDFRRAAAASEIPTDTLVGSASMEGMSPAAKTALRAGFFRPQQITVVEQRPIKAMFKKAAFQYLVMSDGHAGDEDAPAIDVTVQIGQALDVDEVVFAGDWFDAHAISKYVPSADRPARWVDERAQALPIVAAARAAFAKKKAWWINGNHDTRPMRYIDAIAPQLQGLFTLPQLLGIDGLDFSFPDDNRIVIEDKLLIIHGEKVRKDAGASVKAEVSDYGLSVIMGHVHRRAKYEVTTAAQELRGEQPLLGVELGCLANLRPSYLAKEKTANWQHGAAIVSIYANGYVDVEPISIHNGKAAFRGVLFESRVPSTK
jgi:predicted phosphodiesterase